MYTPSLSGQAAVGAAASRLAALRAQLTALTFGCALLSEAEQLQANHNIHECEDVDRLTRWLTNTRAELARRAKARELAVDSVTAQSPAPTRFTTGAQKQHVLRFVQQPRISRTQRIRVLVGFNRLTREEATVLRRQLALPSTAEALDQRVAARFCPSSSLTYADLVRC